VRLLAAAIALLASAPAFAAKCSLALMPPLEVTMRDSRPLVHAQLNGKDALFIADSGAFFSSVSAAAVTEYQLQIDPRYEGLFVSGVAGREFARVARAQTFTLLGTTINKVDFLVAGSHFEGGSIGVLGQNVFRIADVEYDLANGVIRLAQPKDCKNMPLAYWADAEHKDYSTLSIDFATAHEPHTTGVAYLNGEKVRVTFDTGAGMSTLTLDAAKRAGITPTSPGVVDAGEGYGGFGHRIIKSWIATFSSFKIGDEEIKNARLRFGDFDLPGIDMLIGPDFFLSHRIYVASSQRKLYFTYNGGPVFDLRTSPKPAAEAPAADAAAVAPPSAAATTADARVDSPTDASALARRGTASAARHDYASAIADLTRACELAPGESSYFFERGRVYWENRQPDLALRDFDQAIQLKPDNLQALLARASLRARRHAAPETVTADLEAADRAASKEADAHLQIGNLYQYIEQPAAAIVQYSKWIDSHLSDNVLMAATLNDRCWARALVGQRLDLALSDCNAALGSRHGVASFLDSRGLVYLRQGNYDKAIADYDAALHQQPNLPWSLYGRGLAKLHKAKTSEGHTDIAAATALQPKIGELAARYGLSP
jgi:tetratricopeptide (TPR) repeat protein/predicted aspartyl protease